MTSLRFFVITVLSRKYFLKKNGFLTRLCTFDVNHR
jgi:hypothetical protein